MQYFYALAIINIIQFYFMKNILVPTDFSAASRNAAKYAISFAKVFDAKVILLNVVTPPIIVDDSLLAPIMITQAEIVEGNRKLMKKKLKRSQRNIPELTDL